MRKRPSKPSGFIIHRCNFLHQNRTSSKRPRVYLITVCFCWGNGVNKLVLHLPFPGCTLPDLKGTDVTAKPDTGFVPNGDAVSLKCKQHGYSPTHYTVKCVGGEFDPRLDSTCYKGADIFVLSSFQQCTVLPTTSVSIQTARSRA